MLATALVTALAAASPGGVIAGTVTAGPVCPSVREGEDCADRPHAAHVTAAVGDEERAATDAGGDGRYRLEIAAGDYTVCASSPKVLQRGCGRTRVDEGATATLDLSMDTGLRTAVGPARPPIRHDPIPFPVHRKAEMRAYARRHYGLDRFTLVRPKVIVEHMTANTSFSATFNTFASDAPDPELHERPGTCSHFVVDPAGRIHQLVSLGLMCRHTVGLNWTAIGIEHVGLSDGALMGDARQLRASVRLTRWLQGRYGIATRNVIGHNESLTSPYHRERVARLRNQTHADMKHSTMVRYRRLLR